MNYQNKYLKYKNKYLELKNKIGGMMEEDENTFYIYTLGILNWGQLDTILAYWDNSFFAHICSLIPPRFTKIVIIHCDIIQPIMDWNITREEAVELFSGREGVDKSKDTRIIRSTFQTEPLNYEEIRTITPYILIDFAGVFRYTNVIITPTPEGSTQCYIWEQNVAPTSFINLNIIRFGYTGDDEMENQTNRINNRMIGLTKLFKVNPDNTITTFFNKFLDRTRFKELDLRIREKELNEPETRINRMMGDINLLLFRKYKDIKPDFDERLRNIDQMYINAVLKNMLELILNSEMIDSYIIQFLANKLERFL